VKANYYFIIVRAIEEGVKLGLNRAYKHEDRPSREVMEDNIERAIMNGLCEVLEFNDEHSESD